MPIPISPEQSRPLQADTMPSPADDMYAELALTYAPGIIQEIEGHVVTAHQVFIKHVSSVVGQQTPSTLLSFEKGGGTSWSPQVFGAMGDGFVEAKRTLSRGLLRSGVVNDHVQKITVTQLDRRAGATYEDSIRLGLGKFMEKHCQQLGVQDPRFVDYSRALQNLPLSSEQASLLSETWLDRVITAHKEAVPPGVAERFSLSYSLVCNNDTYQSGTQGDERMVKVDGIPYSITHASLKFDALKMKLGTAEMTDDRELAKILQQIAETAYSLDRPLHEYLSVTPDNASQWDALRRSRQATLDMLRNSASYKSLARGAAVTTAAAGIMAATTTQAAAAPGTTGPSIDPSNIPTSVTWNMSTIQAPAVVTSIPYVSPEGVQSPPTVRFDMSQLVETQAIPVQPAATEPTVVQADVHSAVSTEVSNNGNTPQQIPPAPTANGGDVTSAQTEQQRSMASAAGLGGIEGLLQNDPLAETAPLASINSLLADKMQTEITNFTSGLSISTISGDNRAIFTTRLGYLTTAVENDVTVLDRISPEEQQAILTAADTPYGPIFADQLQKNMELLGSAEYGGWLGWENEPDKQKLFAALYTIADLTVVEPDKAQSLLDAAAAQQQAAAQQDAAANADQTAPTAPDAQPAPSQPEASPSTPAVAETLDQASQQELLDLVNTTADAYGWSPQKRLFMQAAILEGYPVLPACVVCGAAGNASVESAGYNANINEFGNGPGFGLFQDSFGRRKALEAAARAAGVDLNVNNLANYRFQLRFAKQEMQTRTLRNGSNQTEWSLYITIKDPVELAWQFQWNFERPASAAPQSRRTKESASIWNQLNDQWNKKQQAIANAAKQKAAAAEAKKRADALQQSRQAEIQSQEASGNFNQSQALPGAVRTPLLAKIEAAGQQNGKLGPDFLATVGSTWGSAKLNPAAADQFRKLDAAFYTQFGRHLGFTSDISAYRSFAAQVNEKEDAVAKGRSQYAATPGYSNHGWGLAADLNIAPGTAEYNWMLANAINYGWVHPDFADNANSFEPWHWEYNLSE